MEPENQELPKPAETDSTISVVSTPYPQGTLTPHHIHAQRKKKRAILTALILMILIAAGVGGWLLFGKTKTNTSQQNQTTAPLTSPSKTNTTEKVAEQVSPELAKFIKPTTGETWLAAPKALPKQGYIKEASSEQYADYYEVGKRGENTIIMVGVNMIGDQLSLLEKSPNGAVTLIEHPDNLGVYNKETDKNDVDFFKASVKIDTATSYDSLSVPRNLTLDKGYILAKPSYSTLGERLSNEATLDANQKPDRQTVKEFGGSKLVRVQHVYADTKLTSIGYEIVTPMQTTINLEYTPLPLEAKSYQWESGANFTLGNYKPITRGCGRIDISVTRGDDVKDSDITETGKTQDGSAVYEFIDPNYSLVTKAYDEFKDYASNDTSVPYANITKADFVKQHAVIAHKDKYGQWLVYTNETLAPAGGCAKPVVYLYPTQLTSVNVKVGADVKVSAPHYNPQTGWNAVAQPNGRLTVAGKPFDSLFWEGPGYGSYPSITEGSIVAKSQAISTIKAQLTAQGLNAKESADFIAYWQDKLPNKPYIRLTWFNTAQLNRLAPLQVTPKPQTTIRVFLDMAGLDRPVALEPQAFTAPKRDGFTVVEWGGLAGFKLY